MKNCKENMLTSLKYTFTLFYQSYIKIVVDKIYINLKGKCCVGTVRQSEISLYGERLQQWSTLTTETAYNGLF
jgi:hypothetical protein